MQKAELLQFTTIPMDEFVLKWRFTDSGSCVMPPNHLSQVKPLAPKDAKRLWELIRQLGIHRGFPFAAGYFRSLVSTRIDESCDTEEEETRIRKWLYRRGIPFRQRVWLSYQPASAIETTWKMLMKYWTVFYYPISDDITVVDGSFAWALLFFHEHAVFFGSNVGDAE